MCCHLATLYFGRMATSVDVNGVEQSKMQFDSTGMFHWCPSRELGSCLMDRQEAAMTVLQVRKGGCTEMG